MPHTGIDIGTHLLLALYPAAAIFFVEVGTRLAKLPSWKKYIMQGIVAIVFAVAYIVAIDATGIAIMLFILAPVLFFYARNVKNNPTIR